MNQKTVSEQTLRRLPVYLHYLRSVRGERECISATALAQAFGLNDVQVRKDLGSVSGLGRPKVGYAVEELIAQLEGFLGCRAATSVILVGAGHLGTALLSYAGFLDYGLDICAAFDCAEDVIGRRVCGIPVLSSEELEAYCRAHCIHLAILTVPASAAQQMCDRLVGCGIRAIWNFAPTILRAPVGVTVENENLASSLAVLTRHLNEGRRTEAGESI